jgi:hypothetical protein
VRIRASTFFRIVSWWWTAGQWSSDAVPDLPEREGRTAVSLDDRRGFNNLV